MKKRVMSILLVLVMALSIVNIPKQVKAEVYLTDEMAQRFVDLIYSNSSDTARYAKKVLTGEEFGTPELLKELLRKATTILGYAEGLDALSYDEQIKLSSISNVVTCVNSAVKIVDNYTSMWESTSSLQKTIDAIQMGMDFATIWGIPVPPVMSATCIAMELTLSISKHIQDSILKEYSELYKADLILSKYSGDKLPSPIGYVTVTSSIYGYTQEQVDAILSIIYREFVLDEVLDSISSSGGGSVTKPTTYTITFDSNCSDVENITETYSSLEDTVTFPSMTRRGYILTDWYWESECITPVEDFTKEDHTFYAKWETYNYTITFDSNCAEVNNIVRTYNSLEETITFPTMTRPRYILKGYAYDSIGIEMVDGPFTKEDHLFYAIWKLDISYRVENGEAIITGCSKDFVDLEIPSVIDGYPVTKIGDEAFLQNSALKNVIIPDSVTSIGANVFTGCSQLKSITIPDSVTSIGGGAFSWCKNLKSVTIGNSVTNIGDYAFNNCAGLTSIDIPDSVTSIGDGAFNNCTGLTNVVIGNSVTNIGDYAFNNCSGLTSIAIPDSVTSIGDGAFEKCTGLTNVVIGNSVTNIGDYAFNNCSGLTSIAIPDSVTSIGDGAFEKCTGLTEINVDSSNTAYTSLDGILFNKDKTELICYPARKTGSYTVPDSVTNIGDYAFNNCAGLTSIDIPGSVTSIGDYAFSDCYSLMSIIIHGNVTSIGDYAFSDCYSLMSIIIHGNVISIGKFAFRFCIGLTSIAIHNSVTSIGDYAFSGCYELTSIIIGNSVTSIGYEAFCWCGSLTDVYYNGTEEEWGKISIGSGNECLRNATIHNRELTAVEKVAVDKATLDLGDLSAVKGNLKLTSIGANGSTITWKISDESVITNTGVVTRGDVDKTVTLTATITNGTALDTRVFTVIVLGIGTSENRVAEDKTALDLGDLSAVKKNLTLPTTGSVNNSTITWETSDKSVITNTGVVTRGDIDKTVTLTATITNGDASDTKVFTVTVPKGLPLVIVDFTEAYNVAYGRVVTPVVGRHYYAKESVAPSTSVKYSTDGDLTTLHIATTRDKITWGDRAGSEITLDLGDTKNVTSITLYAQPSMFAGGSNRSNTALTVDVYAGASSITGTKIGTMTNNGSQIVSDGTNEAEMCVYTIDFPADSIYQYVTFYCNSTYFWGWNEIYVAGIAVDDDDNDEIVSGACGDNITWTLDSEGTLAISGIGDMTAWELESDVPWRSYGENIYSVIIEDGVTSIGASAFANCSGLTSVVIGNSVTSIGDYAFYDCDNLTDVHYNGTEEKWNKISISTGSECLTSANIHFQPAILLGDTNGDGEVDFADAIAVLKHDAGISILADDKLTAADVNDDGEIDFVDAIQILKYDSGLISSFQV